MLTLWNKSLLKEVVFIVLIISQNTVWIVYKRPEFLGTIKDLNFSVDIVILTLDLDILSGYFSFWLSLQGLITSGYQRVTILILESA